MFFPLAQRENVVAAACKRDSPSSGAKNSTLINTQRKEKIDAVYNGRPLELTAPPISIYHPVFAKFRREVAQPIDKTSFTAGELGKTLEFVTRSLAFYQDEDLRISQIDPPLRHLVHFFVLHKSEITTTNVNMKPDGSVFAECKRFPNKDKAASDFSEVKNGIGEGASDPIHQAQCDYVNYYSAVEVWCSFHLLLRKIDCLIA
jgi:hypothetical protein